MNKLLTMILLNKLKNKSGGGVTPTGTINITENGEVDVTQYALANVNVQAVSQMNAKVLTNAGSYFEIKNLIVELPTIDFSNMTVLSNAFSNFATLKKVNLTGTGSVTNLFHCFYFCNDLEDINVFDTSSVGNFNATFTGCNSLTNTSLNNIMQMCINATSYTGTKTLLQLGLSSEQATRCQSLSNYQAFISAGWTTGY